MCTNFSADDIKFVTRVALLSASQNQVKKYAQRFKTFELPQVADIDVLKDYPEDYYDNHAHKYSLAQRRRFARVDKYVNLIELIFDVKCGDDASNIDDYLSSGDKAIPPFLDIYPTIYPNSTENYAEKARIAKEFHTPEFIKKKKRNQYLKDPAKHNSPAAQTPKKKIHLVGFSNSRSAEKKQKSNSVPENRTPSPIPRFSSPSVTDNAVEMDCQVPESIVPDDGFEYPPSRLTAKIPIAPAPAADVATENSFYKLTCGNSTIEIPGIKEADHLI